MSVRLIAGAPVALVDTGGVRRLRRARRGPGRGRGEAQAACGLTAAAVRDALSNAGGG
ncbi:MAG: hypothetical protein AVDCRST_MAG45-2374 [uncultured Solirubrobacterales bacterium]|uniref:Uncharacterized protein n=1 Tax=uncultured Solirubrobacterales bacterium TaxID=768556 RepID=A0A6J4TBE0_9ACTN|nr:MAG: hypothetical protein AVDCRST_MAG45-2374 [uncultured Solirubrobacterales bacterium]